MADYDNSMAEDGRTRLARSLMKQPGKSIPPWDKAGRNDVPPRHLWEPPGDMENAEFGPTGRPRPLLPQRADDKAIEDYGRLYGSKGPGPDNDPQDYEAAEQARKKYKNPGDYYRGR